MCSKEVNVMNWAREILIEMNYPVEMLNGMTDEDCEVEVQEIPYNM